MGVARAYTPTRTAGWSTAGSISHPWYKLIPSRSNTAISSVYSKRVTLGTSHQHRAHIAAASIVMRHRTMKPKEQSRVETYLVKPTFTSSPTSRRGITWMAAMMFAWRFASGAPCPHATTVSAIHAGAHTHHVATARHAPSSWLPTGSSQRVVQGRQRQWKSGPPEA